MDTTVVKGMRVLEALVQANGPARLSDLASELGLQKSNLHRLLNTFLSLGYVAKEEETGRYYATLKTWELGVAILSAHPIRRATAPVLHQLHTAIGETVNLTILDGDDIVYIEKLHSPRPMRFFTRPGTRYPAALTSAGMAILAHHDDAQAIITRTVKAYGRCRKVAAKPLLKQLDEIRRCGYALAQSARNPGIVGLAAPVLDHDERAVASISITGPESRLLGARKTKMVDQLQQACGAASEPILVHV